MEKRKIEFSPPDICDDEIAAVVDTLKSGWITTGPKTKLFEEELAKFCHTKKAVCLSSATACMELTLRLLGIGAGDEVITSAYTYTASASVICHVGATPIIIDTKEDSYQMDYAQLEDAITVRTKAIIPVDLGGVICDYEKIFEIVQRKQALFTPNHALQEVFGRIIVCADAAHSIGAIYKGQRSGEIADFTSFSFHAVKNLTTAEGGAVVWKEQAGLDSEEVYRQYMLLSLHGQTKDAFGKVAEGGWEYDIVAPYYKCNMTDIQASLGLVQLNRYQDILRTRRALITCYDEALGELPVKVLAHQTQEQSSSGHLYLIRVEGKSRAECNEIMREVGRAGVATNVHYKPLPMLQAYKDLGFDISHYPNAYKQYENAISLPLHNKLTREDILYIVDVLRECLVN